MEMELLIWLFFCVAVGLFARERGRSPLLWGALAFFISPLLAGVILAVIKDKKQADEVVKTQMETQQLKDRVTVNETEVNDRIDKVEKRVLDLETTVQEPLKVEQKREQPQIEEGMKICPFCGELIRKGAIKCRYCGTELEEPQMMECPYCKELIRKDAIKCKYCRSDLVSKKPERAEISTADGE